MIEDTISEQEYLKNFLYDTEKLQSISSENTIKQGLLYFKENRVTEMDFDKQHLWAYVEGSLPDRPYYVELTLTDNESLPLHAQCECTSSADAICKHAVALLYHYAKVTEESLDHDVKSAKAEAISDRIKRGKTEVNVRHISGKPSFGEWEASSLVSSTHRPQIYQVHIRSLEERINYCSCPDHAINLLGTCKHIEAVIYKLKKSDHEKTVKNSFVYLSWNEADAPKIRIWRSPLDNNNLKQMINEYFSADGQFKGQIPDDFFAFSNQKALYEDLLIGEDVHRYIGRLMEKITQQRKSEQITQQINHSNGILPDIRIRLYPYQVEGVAFLVSRGRALLADDMGLGKTLQAITSAIWLKNNANINKTIIICPASLKHQWAREIEKFTGLSSQIIQGPADARMIQYRSHEHFFIVNYELVMRDLSVINEQLRPDLLILDEAQRIKNWRTKIASTIKLIHSRYAFVLSGTPMENRLEDLYSLMQVVDPNVLGPLWRYLLDYHISDDKGKVLGYRNLSHLRKLIAPVLLRRDRSLVKNQLPDKTQIRLDIQLTVVQQELHDSAMVTAAGLAQIAKKRPLTPSESNRLMAALQQARMACNAAGLVDKETIGSPKLDELASLMEQLCIEDNQKVVIFSQWERMTVMAESIINKLNLNCVRLHGGIPSAKRGELIEKFHQDDSISAFVSTDAGATGLNLQCATVLINLDVPWNPAILEQRNARIHRLGQKEKVQIILMVAENAYEEKVLSLLQNKQNLFDNVIETGASEDVVGINKKMLNTLIDDLTDEENNKSTEEKAQTKALASTDKDIIVPDVSSEQVDKALSEIDTHQTSFEDEDVKQCISKLQHHLGHRLEKVSARQGGFLVVVSNLEADDQQLAGELSKLIPVAIIDIVTMNNLLRIGQILPTDGSEIVLQEKQLDIPTSPLIQLAKRKLKSAEILIEQLCFSDAIGLMTDAMLSKVAGEADLDKVPGQEQATIWLYAEALPKGIVNNEQVTAILRAMSLQQAEDIPEPLFFEVLKDARSIVG